ncbi:sugar transporter [Rhodobacteraceae bacterium KMM 6894]|nr:sugar transporter [Rhodobacteraceae bacterium KMM 6894]
MSEDNTDARKPVTDKTDSASTSKDSAAKKKQAADKQAAEKEAAAKKEAAEKDTAAKTAATAKKAARKPAASTKKSPATKRSPAKASATKTAAVTSTDAAVPTIAGPSRVRKRHRVILISFFVCVLLPMVVAFWYGRTHTVDQYHSLMSFSVRKEQTQSAADILGGLSQISGGSSSDTDILYQYIQSQELIELVDEQLNLRALYSAPHDRDKVFALQPGATIEELVRYWPRVVRMHYDRAAGIIELRVLAFSAQDARRIAEAILKHSADQINRLSAVAREDTMRYAQEELNLAVQRMTAARQAMTEFRLTTQIVDPFADFQGQQGLLNTLQAELATALIELGLLRETAANSDPRIVQAERRIRVIRAQIAGERAKFGIGGQGPGGEDYATLIAEFERLNVDREFAEQAYKSALSAFDGALAEAQRQSRYLAAHIRPTLAESSEYPRITMILGIAFAFLLVLWATGILIFYSIRDRR